MRPLQIALLVGALAVSGCGGSDAPIAPQPPDEEYVLTIVDRGPAADTVNSRVSLRVRVTRGGQPARGSLSFSAGLLGQYPFALVQGTAESSASLVLDSYGEAVLEVFFGSWAGEGFMRISGLGISDSVHYRLLPGRAVRISFSTRDTALVADRMFTLLAATEDRIGNRRSDPVELEVTNPERITLTGDQVRTVTEGRGWIRATSGALIDSAGVSIVPAGRFVAVEQGGDLAPILLVSRNIDGTGREVLLTRTPGTSADAPRWNPRQPLIAFHAIASTELAPPRRLHTLAPGEQVARVFDDPRILEETQPVFSPDGEWIYFSARRDWQAIEVWRVRVDGTDLEAITPEAGYYDRDYNPHPSPDGTRLVYSSNRGGGSRSRIVDLADGTVHALDVEGRMPRWSPRGDLIAYLLNGELWVMRPDGTGQRLLASVGLPGFGEYFDWSPDGRFVIARTSGGIALVDVSNGELLPIPGTSFVRAPAWQSLPSESVIELLGPR